MKKEKIDWNKVWKSFNSWFEHYAKDYTWETQAKQIEKIIERELRSKNAPRN